MNHSTFITRSSLLLAASLLFAPAHSTIADSSSSTNVYSCHHTSGPIKIDGKLDEPSWNNARSMSFYVPVTFAEPISKTEARIMWDSKYVYVGFKAYDKDVFAMNVGRDSRTCADDVLEFFFQPNPAKSPYYNFEINALGSIYDAYSLKRYAGGENNQRWSRWNCKGIKVGITINGTLNNAKDVDKYWQMEIAVPLDEVVANGAQRPTVGSQWKVNLARYDYSVYLPDGLELTSCCHLSKVDYHLMADWDTIEFVD